MKPPSRFSTENNNYVHIRHLLGVVKQLQAQVDSIERRLQRVITAMYQEADE